MSSQNVYIDILNTLEDLTDDTFDKFCSILKVSGEPQIRAAEVDKKSRAAITNLLVSRWTEAKAVSRMVDILNVIGCNNEAEKLAAKAGAQAQPQQEPSRAPPPGQASSAETEVQPEPAPRRDRSPVRPQASSSRDNPSRTPQQDAKTLLSSVRTSFVKNVTDAVLNELLDRLFSERVLTKQEMDTARAKTTRADKARLVVDSVIMKGSDSAQILIDGYCKLDPKSELCAQLRN